MFNVNSTAGSLPATPTPVGGGGTGEGQLCAGRSGSSGGWEGRGGGATGWYLETANGVSICSTSCSTSRTSRRRFCRRSRRSQRQNIMKRMAQIKVEMPAKSRKMFWGIAAAAVVLVEAGAGAGAGANVCSRRSESTSWSELSGGPQSADSIKNRRSLRQSGGARRETQR